MKHDLADELSAADLVALNERADPVLAALGTLQRMPRHPSIVTGIVRTNTHDMIGGKMGELPTSELHAVEDTLREILAL